MKWLSPVLLAALLGVAVWVGGPGGAGGEGGESRAVARRPQGLRTVTAPQTVAPRVEADKNSIRFETVDVFVDSGPASLAAWQLTIAPRTRDGAEVTLVGIEGGEHAAFSKPAYYDPAALSPAGGGGGGRVVLAAYSTGKELPTGRTRVARLHVMVEGGRAGGSETEFNVTLTVAADSQGRAIDGASAAVSEAREASTGGDR